MVIEGGFNPEGGSMSQTFHIILPIG